MAGNGTAVAEHDVARRVRRERWRLLRRLDALTEGPMVVLAFVWLALLVVDFTAGLSPVLQLLNHAVWAVFVLDFLLGLLIAPDRGRYLRHNWLTAVSLLLPALRLLRVARVVRVLRAARAARSLGLLRLLTSLNRGMGALGRTLGRRGVGYVAALTLLVTFGGAAGMAFFESPAALADAGVPAADRAGVADFGDALWWTAMTMTTLGGSYEARTAEGRLLTFLLALYALAASGYLTASIASHFIAADRADRAVPDPQFAALRAELAALRRELAAATDRPGAMPGAASPGPRTRTVGERPAGDDRRAGR